MKNLEKFIAESLDKNGHGIITTMLNPGKFKKKSNQDMRVGKSTVINLNAFDDIFEEINIGWTDGVQPSELDNTIFDGKGHDYWYYHKDTLARYAPFKNKIEKAFEKIDEWFSRHRITAYYASGNMHFMEIVFLYKNSYYKLSIDTYSSDGQEPSVLLNEDGIGIAVDTENLDSRLDSVIKKNFNFESHENGYECMPIHIFINIFNGIMPRTEVSLNQLIMMNI